jgi:hypothetical protein
MQPLLVHHAIWYIRQSAVSASPFGWLAVALSLFCASFLFSVLFPLQQQLALLKSDAGSLTLPDKSLRRSTAAPASERALSDLYTFFPPQDGRVDAMEKIYAAAAKFNLNLDQGDYQLVQERDLKLARYEMVLPVRGDYVQIRKFVALALSEVPTLALDGISLTRQNITDPTVDAQLRMTLYLGAD